MDKNIVVKVTKIFTILIMVAAAVLTAFVVIYSEDLKTDAALADKILNPTFGLGFLLLGLGILITLGFWIMGMISNPKTAVRALISIALLGLVYLIAYLLASDTTDAKVYVDFDISSAESKLIGSLIYLVYILGGLSILAIVYSGVNKLLLNR
jgi:hypothetical protein